MARMKMVEAIPSLPIFLALRGSGVDLVSRSSTRRGKVLSRDSSFKLFWGRMSGLEKLLGGALAEMEGMPNQLV